MKKIQPARRYDLDDGYPSDTEAPLPDDGKTITRRGILGAMGTMALGAATLGTTLLLPTEARGADPTCVSSLTLKPRFRFCGATYGQLVVHCPDSRFVATLRQPGESRRLRKIVQLALKRGGSCTWLKDPRSVAQMEVAIAAAIRTYYKQHLCLPAIQLKVQLAIIPPAAPNPPADPDPPGRPQLGGVPRLPRHRGCASCSTAAEPQDLLLPLGLTVLSLYALRRRENGHDA